MADKKKREREGEEKSWKIRGERSKGVGRGKSRRAGRESVGGHRGGGGRGGCRCARRRGRGMEEGGGE